MELVHFDEHNYQLKLQAYQIVSLTLNTNPLVLYIWKLELVAKHLATPSVVHV
jgi:predicted secreted protein